MMYSIGIDPDLQHPALSASSEQGVLFVSCLKTSKSKQADAVVEIAKEATHWMDRVADELAHAGHFPQQCGVVVVEGQEIYRGKTQNPQDIVYLAAVAGALMQAAALRWPSAMVDYPSPKQWKGSVPKRIHQARVLTKLGIEYDAVGTKTAGYCVPRAWPNAKPIGADKLNKSNWKHVVDAIGLSVFGHTIKEQRSRFARLTREGLSAS